MGKYQDELRHIADTYGYDAQSRQLVEEMAELTQGINKYWRHTLQCGKKDQNEILPEQVPVSIVSEIADVEIMLAQVKYLLKCDRRVEREIRDKIRRQLSRLPEGEYITLDKMEENKILLLLIQLKEEKLNELKEELKAL